jgi:hypothetical protein
MNPPGCSLSTKMARFAFSGVRRAIEPSWTATDYDSGFGAPQNDPIFQFFALKLLT